MRVVARAGGSGRLVGSKTNAQEAEIAPGRRPAAIDLARAAARGHHPPMTIAHRIRIPVDASGLIQLQLPHEFVGTEAEVIVLSERTRSAKPTSSEAEIESRLRGLGERFRHVPAIPLTAMDRGNLYDRDRP